MTFSILERIDVGETGGAPAECPARNPPFSILERIDVGETRSCVPAQTSASSLSVSSNGSTWVKLAAPHAVISWRDSLSVSSNGSTWVKQELRKCLDALTTDFQYPRTDRRG